MFGDLLILSFFSVIRRNCVIIFIKWISSRQRVDRGKTKKSFPMQC
jgi:hypothetical protein